MSIVELLEMVAVITRSERERCAKIAETYGYTYNENSHQPWAADLNLKLRAQRAAIADKIREDVKI